MLSVIMLNVVILSVVMPSVVAPVKRFIERCLLFTRVELLTVPYFINMYQVLLGNMRLGLKSLQGINVIAYFDLASLAEIM
jgi:hypothetical protein